MKKTVKHSHALATRNILACALVLVVVGASAGFYYGLQLVKAYALDVSHVIADANASGNSVTQLSTLKEQLSEKDTLLTKANQIFSTPDTYLAQAKKDITTYAANANIGISNIQAIESGANAVANQSATQSQTASSLSIAIEGPISYRNFLKFLDSLEGNLPKMQTSNISISRSVNGPADQIVVEAMTIAVATR